MNPHMETNKLQLNILKLLSLLLSNMHSFFIQTDVLLISVQKINAANSIGLQINRSVSIFVQNIVLISTNQYVVQIQKPITMNVN